MLNRKKTVHPWYHRGKELNNTVTKNETVFSEFWGFHGSDYEDYSVPESDTMQPGRQYQCFKGTQCLQLQGTTVSSTLEMEVACSCPPNYMVSLSGTTMFFFYAGRNEHKGIKCETRTYTRLERRKTKGTGIIKDTAGECYAWIIIFLWELKKFWEKFTIPAFPFICIMSQYLWVRCS